MGRMGALAVSAIFKKSPVPRSVFDALEAEPADLACREYDYRLLSGKGFGNSFDMSLSACSRHVRYGQEQSAERRNVHQQVVGDNLHIRAYPMYQFQESKAVEGADRMVGNDHHLTGSGDVFSLGVGHGKTEVEIVQYLLDELDTLQMRISLGKILKGLFVEESPQQGFDERTTDFATVQGGVMGGHYLINSKHST